MMFRPVHAPGCRAHIAGFTLIEVLATLMILAIVIPVTMRGISLASAAAEDARNRGEAAALGESRLAQIVASQQWQSGNVSGDFPSPTGSATPDYHWQMLVLPWPGDQSGAGVQEIDLTVSWTARNKQSQMVLSTLAYPATMEQ